MAAHASTLDPAQDARSILTAFSEGDLGALDRALEHSASLVPPFPDMPAEQAERLELISAIACELRCQVARMRRGLARHLEGAEVMLSLLAHLARRPALPATVRRAWVAS